MSKHKHFHSLRGKGKRAAMYAFHHRANALAAASQPQQKKNTALRAANTKSGDKVEQNLTTVSTSSVPQEKEDTQV